MRVLILTQYFTPEIGATSARVHTFAAGLAARGHDVEVICEVPNHPRGVVQDGFGGRPLVRRRLDGFHVSWVWVATKPEKATRDRLAFYASYAAMSVAWGSITARPNVLFASSPPLPVGAAAATLARRHRVPWVLDVRDLWPAAAAALGELSSERALRLAERLERFLYRDADAVTTVTQPFVDHVEAIAERSTPVHLLPNGTTRYWVDAADIAGDKEAAALSPEQFTWTFAGNVGLAQGLDTAIEAARLLGDGFRLIILGDGAARPELERVARERAPGLVEFRDQLPPEQAVTLLRASDALLVSLSADPVLAPFVPSKLFDFCAVGRPVVLAAAGEAPRLAAADDAALIVEPGDPQGLAAALERLQGQPELAISLERSGRVFAQANMREGQLERLETLLRNVCAT